MSQEEKAKELASKYARQYHHNTYPKPSSNSEFVFSNEEIDKACLEMAKWKEQQMIDKAWDWILRYVLCTIPLECQKVMEKAFRKEMED